MTKTEFDQWFDHHCSRFTGIGSWLEKFPEIGSGATQKSVLEAWYLAVSSLSLANAKWATDQMFASANKPRSFDDHPARVVELNRNAANGKSDGSGSPRGDRRCVCEGTGMVEVANDRPNGVPMFCMRDQTPNPKPFVTVACNCNMGGWINARRTEFVLPVYDPARMRLGTEVRAEQARQRMESRGLSGLSFGQQIERVLKRFGAMPRDVDIEARRSASTDALREISERRAEREAQEAAGLEQMVPGCPF